MDNIEEKVVKNYQENMEFFNSSHKELYNKIIALEVLMQEGKYAQKYELEYNDGYFDVVDIKTGSKLYGKNSVKFSEDLCNEVTYKKNDQTFKSYRKYLFDKKDLKILSNAPVYANFSTVAEIMDFHNQLNRDDMSLLQIEKYIFLGSGLGMHIEKIVKKFDVQVSLIVEDDIELFRLSLFTTNYKKLFENRVVYFSIAKNSAEFEVIFTNFFQKAFFKNMYIKFTIFSSQYEEKIEIIRSYMVSRVETTYPNERLMLKNRKVVDSIKKGYKFIDLRKKENETFFKDKPFLVLGAGPSLSYNKEWIAKNRDKFVIVAAFTALKALKTIGVSPDIAVHIDENETVAKEMVDDLGDLAFLDNTLMFFSASVSSYLLEKFDKSKIYLHEDRTRYKLSKSTLQVTSVGDTVYSIALIFNPSEIYMLGLDMALSLEGETHSKEHFRRSALDENSSKVDKEDFQLFNKKIKVKGNLLREVETLPIFLFSIPIINLKTKTLKSPHQKIYNLSQNGAYFEDTIPLNIEDVNISAALDRDKLSKELKELFDIYASSSLSKEEMEAIDKRYKQIKEYKEIVENFKNYPTTPKENFSKSFVDLVGKTINQNFRFELWEILYIYAMRIGPYVDDLFYTKEIRLRKKELKFLKEIIAKKYSAMINTYKEILYDLKED